MWRAIQLTNVQNQLKAINFSFTKLEEYELNGEQKFYIAIAK